MTTGSEEMSDLFSKIQSAAAAIRRRHAERPVLGLILGSGLGAYAESLEARTVIRFEELPHFPRATVPGHAGKLVLGRVEGIPVVASVGRAHFYEGYSMSEVVFPTRVLGCLGIRQLVVTNAAGGIRPGFQAGDLMLITDHINLMFGNPLVGANPEELGVRFPDMGEAYDKAMGEITLQVAAEKGISLQRGVYVGVSGPSYETPAEIRMLRSLGADAVGMSTVPEVIAANHMRIRVLGISCITNVAAGIHPHKVTHQEVMDAAAGAQERFVMLLRGIVPRLPALTGAEEGA